MYQPQWELLMPDQSLQQLDAGHQSHLAASAVASIPAAEQLNFHLLHCLDTAAAAASGSVFSPQPAVDNFFDQPPVQFHETAAPGDYYGHYSAADAYFRGTTTTAASSPVFGLGAADGEPAYCLVNPLESLPTQRTRGSRKRSRGTRGFDGGPTNGKEKQRRKRSNEKFTALKLLIPNLTKDDKATIVSDAAEYIQELVRTVKELTLLVEKKRRRREHQADTESSEGELVRTVKELTMQPIRSTYILRRSKETSVDVRIVDDEVNIKLTKRGRDGRLAAASRALNDLHLELIHLSGGKIGECHIYMFNTMIHEGSQVFASAVASKLIEVVDEC